MLSCSSKNAASDHHSNAYSNETEEENGTEVYLDVENCFKQWNADNPKRPDIDDREITAESGPAYQKAYKEYITNNFGQEHSRTAIVRMYNDCPRASYDNKPLNDAETTSMNVKIDNYTVYSIWRGPVIAQSNKSGNWFVVWDEDYHYNTKYISDAGDGVLKMEYVECPDIDNNCNVIYYNINTHNYYFVKEKYSGNQL